VRHITTLSGDKIDGVGHRRDGAFLEAGHERFVQGPDLFGGLKACQAEYGENGDGE
jgi:hypothetical protein